MEYELFNDHLLKSFDEEEAFAFGGPWQASFAIDNFTLPGKYLLEDDISTESNNIGLIQIDILGRWRRDVRFSIVVIDTKQKQLLKSKKDFSELSIVKIDAGKVYFIEVFNSQEAEATDFLEINDSNFIQLSDLPPLAQE